MPAKVPVRVWTLAEVAVRFFGLHPRSLQRRRHGDRVVLDDGSSFRVIRNARRTWVADAELARFFGERAEGDHADD